MSGVSAISPSFWAVTSVAASSPIPAKSKKNMGKSKSNDNETGKRKAENTAKSSNKKSKQQVPTASVAVEEEYAANETGEVEEAAVVAPVAATATASSTDKTDSKAPKRSKGETGRLHPKFTPEEDAKILEGIEKNRREDGGIIWVEVANYVGGTRQGKDIQNRFTNYLDPRLARFQQGPMTAEEKTKIMELASKQLAAGGNQVARPGRKLGTIDWDAISKEMNRPAVRCNDAYKNEVRRIKVLTGKIGPEQVEIRNFRATLPKDSKNNAITNVKMSKKAVQEVETLI